MTAAKEEAFQESIKLKNQFRNLDEDEVEFLDSVLESTRRKEEEVRRETGEQLDAFRRLQEEKDKELLEGSIVGEDVNGDGKSGSPVSGEGQWAVNARKRKRAKEKEGLRGVKLRKTSSTSERPAGLVKGAREGSARDTEEVRDASLATTGKPMEDVGDSDSPARGIDKTAARLSPERENAARQKLQTTAGLGLADYSSDDED